MNTSDYQIEKKVKDLLKQKEMSFKELCEKIEMTEAGLSRTLKNQTLKVDTLNKISDVLGVDIDWFFAEIVAMSKMKIGGKEIEPFFKLSRRFTAIEAKLLNKHLQDIQKMDELEDEVNRLKKENGLLSELLEKTKQVSNQKEIIDGFFKESTDMLINAIGHVLLDIERVGKKHNLDLKNEIENSFGYQTMVKFLKSYGKEVESANKKRQEMIIKKRKEGKL